MALPTAKELRPAILEIVEGMRSPLRHKEIEESLKERFTLTDNERRKMIHSGARTVFESRMRGVVYDLWKRGLLEKSSYGRYQIAPLGRKWLEGHSDDIEETNTSDAVDSTRVDVDTSPEEKIGSLHRELNDRLADEVLDGVKDISPDSFERLVVRLLERMGYGDGKVVGGSGDKGIDGIINQDPLGLEKVYIQAKRWQNQVGEPEIRNFSASLEAKGASKGVFITTSSFRSNARQAAQFISAGGKFIRLINGEELARLMINHGVGVITETTYEVKQLDENYFVDL